MKSIVFSLIILGISSTNTEVTWPSGRYGLPKAKSGCPKTEGRTWKEGWRKQDLEDDRRWRSEIPSYSHMEAKLSGNNINRTFCMKTELGISTREWPRGSYCVYKSSDSSCPEGMKDGWVKWDDEDNKGGNNNKKGGILPDGIYNDDTIIEYCCQDEGHWDNDVQLPVARPFYLLPLNSASYNNPKCQIVKWAMSWLEYIVYDTSDYKSSDGSSGSHVFVELNGDSSPKMFYCYYKGCRYKLTGNSGSFSWPNPPIFADRYPQYKLCSWLVTVSTTHTILLTFTFHNIPICGQSFVKIFDGLNDTAPLLSTHCGENATSGSTIASSTNNVFVILKSGTYIKDTNIHVRFGVQYTAQLKPTEITTIPTSLFVSSSMVTTVKTTNGSSTSWSSTSWSSTSWSSPQPKLNHQTTSLPVTYIVIPVIAGVIIILVVTVILIYIRKRRQKAASSDSQGINRSYEMRKDATVSNQIDSDCYASPSSPAEKLWPGASSISREGRNPIYESADENVYCSTDNERYEPAAVLAGDSRNPLYNAPDVENVYTEPSPTR